MKNQERADKFRNNGDEKFSITQKQVEIFFLSALLTALVYAIVTKWIIPGVGFIDYFMVEILILSSMKLLKFVTKRK